VQKRRGEGGSWAAELLPPRRASPVSKQTAKGLAKTHATVALVKKGHEGSNRTESHGTGRSAARSRSRSLVANARSELTVGAAMRSKR